MRPLCVTGESSCVQKTIEDKLLKLHQEREIIRKEIDRVTPEIKKASAVFGSLG